MLSHEVFCRLKKQHGCPWKGPLNKLEDHLKDCSFVDTNCPKKCGKQLKKKDLKQHLEKECPNRTVPCNFCKESVKWNKLENHYQGCPKYPQACEKCEKENIPRDMMENHFDKECPNTEIKCPFNIVGCSYKGLRAAVTKHVNEQLTSHMMDMSKAIADLLPAQGPETQTQRNPPRRTRGGMEARPQEQAAQDVFMGEFSAQLYQQRGKINGLLPMVFNHSNMVPHVECWQEEACMRQERPIQELTLRNPQRCTRYGMEACRQEQAAQDVYMGELSAQEAHMRQERPIQEPTLRNPQRRPWRGMEARPQEQAAQGVYMGKWSAQEARMRQERPIQKLKMRDGGPKCPVDNEHLNESQLYPDSFVKREMLSHEGLCRLKKQHGCRWKGPLNKLEIPPKKTTKEIQEEEELQLAIALSLSLEEAAEEGLRAAVTNHVNEQLSSHMMDMSEAIADLVPAQGTETQPQRNPPRRTLGGMEARPQEQAAQDVYMGELSAQTRQQRGEIDDLRHMVTTLSNTVQRLERRLEEARMRQNPQRHTRGSMEARPQEQATQDVYMGELSALTYQQRREIDDLRHMITTLFNTVQHLERWQEEARMREE